MTATRRTPFITIGRVHAAVETEYLYADVLGPNTDTPELTNVELHIVATCTEGHYHYHRVMRALSRHQVAAVVAITRGADA